jgi:hypothetical protein
VSPKQAVSFVLHKWGFSGSGSEGLKDCDAVTERSAGSGGQMPPDARERPAP